MKKYSCVTTVLGAEKLWDISMDHPMMIHFVKQILPGETTPAMFVYEITMDEEEAIIVVLKNEGVTLVAK